MIALKLVVFSRNPAASRFAAFATSRLFLTASALISGFIAAVTGLYVIDSAKVFGPSSDTYSGFAGAS